MDALPVIKGLPIPIIQLFQNIISNAIKFQKKETNPQISISAKEYDSKWLVSIVDNGIGIKKEDCSKIFKEFGKVHENKDFDGYGIGLATCQKIVKQHSGEIWVNSELGQGSTFNFTLMQSTGETLKTEETQSEKVGV